MTGGQVFNLAGYLHYRKSMYITASYAKRVKIYSRNPTNVRSFPIKLPSSGLY